MKMRDPDRYLPDPGVDDAPTIEEIRAAADRIYIDDWLADLVATGGDDDALIDWARDRYRELIDIVDQSREKEDDR